MNNQIENHEIDPELDVRLTAMVMGEASDFEIAQLEEQMLQRPELRDWYERLLVLHKSLSRIAEDHYPREDSEWKLPSVQRKSLLDLWEGNELKRTQANIRPSEKNETVYQRLWKYKSFIGLVSAASLLLCATLAVSLASRFNSPRSLSKWDYDRALSVAMPPSTNSPADMNQAASLDESRLGESPVVGNVMETPAPTASSDYFFRNNSIDSPKSTTSAPAMGSENHFGFVPATPALPPGANGNDAVAKELSKSSAPASDRQRELESGFGVNAELNDAKSNDGMSPPATPPTSSLGTEVTEPMANDVVAGLGGGGRSNARTLEEQLSEGKPTDAPSEPRIVDELASQELDRLPRFTVPPGATGKQSGRSDLNLLSPLESDKFGSKLEPSSESLPSRAPTTEPQQQVTSGKKLGIDEDFSFQDGKDASVRGELAQKDIEKKEADALTVGQADKGYLSSESKMGRTGSDGAKQGYDFDRQMADLEGRPIDRGTPVPKPSVASRDLDRSSTDKSELGREFKAKSKADEASMSSSGELQNQQAEKLWDRESKAVEDSLEEPKRVDEMVSNNRKAGAEWFEAGKKLRKGTAAPESLGEKLAEDESFSTFSLHVSDVSFKLALASLVQGQWPEATKIRLEEFVNAFDYRDPLPSADEKVACRVEQAVHPFLMQRNILRVSMRTSALGRSSNTPLRLTLLLDNSGSMERMDRRQTVRRAFESLSQQLGPNDQVTLISFSSKPRLLADRVNGAKLGDMLLLLDNLPSEGGTNIEAALNLAFEKALEQKEANTQNRIILLTDGAVNLGDADPDSLSKMIIKMRDRGIAFDAAGISALDLNDEVLEALTRQGDGRYYLLDSVEAASAGFADQIAGALRPSAKNVKVQVEFNPQRVGRYKLLGFEKHQLKKEDFRNDKVDAAELAAAEAGVAMYQFEAKSDGIGDIGSVSVRFQDIATGMMIEKRWPIPYEPGSYRIEEASPSLKVSTAAVMLAAKLRAEALGESVDLKTLSSLVASLPEAVRNTERVQQLQVMIEKARQIIGNPSNE